MSNSKHAHLRYNVLDLCFRKRSYTFDDLLTAVNNHIETFYPNERVSIRTLREDLKVFRDKKNGFGAPLPEKARILKYSDPNFSIAQRPLLEYEQYLIDTAQQLLERFENHPKYDKLAEALVKFHDEDEQDDDTSKILYYDHNEEYKGIKYLKPLYLAIKKKHVLQVTYKGFKDEMPRQFEFHPHVLKQYNRRWFVFGYNKSIDRWVHSIPLDERLIEFQIMEDNQYIQTEKDWSNHFRTMIGVVRPPKAQIEKVVLRFHNGREYYFKTKPFIPDYEEFFETHKQDQVWFDTIINNELVQQILSYGQDIEVLEPESLKDKIKEEIIGMHSFYNT